MPWLDGASRFYRGWQVTAAAFVCAMLCIGGTIYSFGVLVEPLTREFQLSRTQVNTGMIALLVGMAVWGALIGRLVDRMPIRIVMPAGAFLLGSGFLLLARAGSPMVMVLAAIGPIAAGVSAAGGLAANAVVSRWFRRRRGRAMGFMAVAASMGGFMVTPLMALLVTHLGWRGAVAALGAGIAFTITILALLFIRDRPTAYELSEAGELSGSESHRQSVVEQDWSAAALVRDRNFWLIAAGVGLLLASDQALIITNVPYFLDKGVDLQAASLLMAVQSASAVCGKLLVGWLAERMDIRRLFGIIAAFHILMLLLYVAWPGYWLMMLAFAVIGVAIGGVYPVWMTLTAQTFGSRSFGTVMGLMAFGTQVLAIVAIRYIGDVFDRTGSYNMAFLSFVGAVSVSWLLIARVRHGGRNFARQHASA